MNDDVVLSELSDAHEPAVVELCRVALELPEDAAEATAMVARLRAAGAMPGSARPRRAVGVVAVENGTVVGAALGSLSHHDPAIGHIDLFAVLPRARRRGVGRALLARSEAALAALGAGEVRLAGNAPCYVWPGIDVRYTPAICVALSSGYEHYRTAWNMTVDLSHDVAPALLDTAAAEERLAAQDIVVRRASPDDLDTVTEFARVNFGGAWDSEVAHSIGRTDAGCHLAVRSDGVLLGFAAYGSSRPSWFGPMGTATEAQGLGIGGVLLRRCLREQRAAGHERVQIGWVGPVPFYAKHVGARVERVFFLYRKPL